jgi:hypothetical protein
MSLAFLLGLLAQTGEQAESADVAEEGLHIIIGMLLTALVFIAVIALGQLGRHLSHRRQARRAAERAY